MDKVLVEIFIPAADKRCDIFLPRQLPLHEAMNMLRNAVGEMCGGLFEMDENTVLCSRESGAIFDINLSVGELGLKNGSRLILI